MRPVDGGKYQIIDGHLRAKRAPNMEIPVLVTDLSPEEAERKLTKLATLIAGCVYQCRASGGE